MDNDEKARRIGKTAGLVHFALRCARQGGLSEAAAKELNELIARLLGDSIKLHELQEIPPTVWRYDSEKYWPILECAMTLLFAGKKRRGMAGIIKRQLRSDLSEKQILRILHEFMPALQKEIEKI
jgi:hypothetical protein